MALNFKFPDVGEGITEGTIVTWKKKVGDSVKTDEPIAEVETDKAIVDITSPRDGVILNVNHKVGETINVGEILAVIGDKGEDIDSKKSESKKEVKKEKSSKPKEAKKAAKYTGSVVGFMDEKETVIASVEKTSIKKSSNKKIKATLRIRKLAKEKGIDLSTITGTGNKGRITEDDLKSGNKNSKQTTAVMGDKVPLKGLRKVISDNMEKSFRNTVPVTNFYDVNITSLWNLREKEKIIAKKKGVKLTFLAYILKSLADTLKDHPYLNSSLVGNEIILKKFYNLGVAVDTDDGLVVPVINDIDKKELYSIANDIVDLATRAKTRQLKVNEMKNSTFTVTNLGSIGVKYFTPIINYPESAILGLGKIEDRITTDGENIVLQKILPLSLTYDHKIVDGAVASRFMIDFIKKLEEGKIK
jgi:pyruvate dehydrogenase E2 component (dihydrolipoamide acetyltransferase)